MTQQPDQPSFEPPLHQPRLGDSFSPGPQQPSGQGEYPRDDQSIPYGNSRYGQQPTPPAYPGAVPPQPYPPQPYPPQGYPNPSAAPQGGVQQPWPPQPAQQLPMPHPPVEAPEQVGKGLGFAVIGIVAGCVASAAMYHWGFIASIVAFGMSVGMMWLYVKGAGTAPRKGAVPLVALVVAGLVIAWIFTLGAELFLGAMSDGVTAGEAFAFATGNITNPKLYSLTAKDALFFFGFGALGMFGTVRQLLGARKAA